MSVNIEQLILIVIFWFIGIAKNRIGQSHKAYSNLGEIHQESARFGFRGKVPESLRIKFEFKLRHMTSALYDLRNQCQRRVVSECRMFQPEFYKSSSSYPVLVFKVLRLSRTPG